MMSLKSVKQETVDCHDERKVDRLKGDILMSKSIEKFNNDLHTVVTCYEEGNFTMSGLSTYLALSMCSLGAKDSTAKEMLSSLYLGKSSNLTNIKNVISHFHEVKNITLGIANRTYADKKIVVKESFKSDVKNIFLSDVKNVEFQSETEKTVNDINDWCSKQTNNKIQSILSKDDIDSTTRLIVLNAVYFKAYWQSEFQALYTKIESFYVSKTKTINIPIMNWAGFLRYKDLPEVDAECVAKPYRDPDFLFVIIKPKEIDGLRYLEQNLDKIDLDYQTMDTSQIHLALPKFKIETTLELNKYLQKLGMIEMFTREANFLGISDTPILVPPLHIDKVLQKVFIEVNERGTEAAAVTMSKLRGGGLTTPFTVDRPFLYRIVNVKHNLTLFSGRVVSPRCS